MKYKVLCLFVLVAFACSPESKDLKSKQSKDSEKNFITKKDTDLKTILEAWSDSFIDKVDSNYQAIINFQLNDSTDQYHVQIKKKGFQILTGLSKSANFSIKSSLEHYNKIYRGEMTALTSMSKAKWSDPTPLMPDLHKPIKGDLMNDGLFFAQRFFNRTSYDLVKLGLKNSRVVHGGHAIPIFYRTSDEIGVRSAWYQINKGEHVNEPGDTNPFPQYFIVIRGNGYAKIGSDTIQIKANEAYYVPPHSDHVFWNNSKEPIEFIFLAWGKGA